MALSLKTITEYWRKSGGEYDHRTEKAIAGKTLIDSEHGDLLMSMHNNLKAATSDRAELLDALKYASHYLYQVNCTAPAFDKAMDKIDSVLEQFK